MALLPAADPVLLRKPLIEKWGFGECKNLLL